MIQSLILIRKTCLNVVQIIYKKKMTSLKGNEQWVVSVKEEQELKGHDDLIVDSKMVSNMRPSNWIDRKDLPKCSVSHTRAKSFVTFSIIPLKNQALSNKEIVYLLPQAMTSIDLKCNRVYKLAIFRLIVLLKRTYWDQELHQTIQITIRCWEIIICLMSNRRKTQTSFIINMGNHNLKFQHQ